MSEWITITLTESGLQQRARKSSISTYGCRENGRAYIQREGHSINVQESIAELKAALEDDES